MAAYASKGRNVSMVAALDKLDIPRLVSSGITAKAPKEEKEIPVLAIGTVTSLAVFMILFLLISFLCYHKKHRRKNKAQKQYDRASHSLERRRIGAPTSLPLTFSPLPLNDQEHNFHDVITNCADDEVNGEKFIDDDSCIHFIDMDPVIFHYHKDITTPLIPESRSIDKHGM